MSETNGTLPQKPKRPFSAQEMNILHGLVVNSLLTTRANLLNGGSRTLDRDPSRDLDKECNYPPTLTLEHYNQMWERGSYAKRVVSLYPTETWSVGVEVKERRNTDRPIKEMLEEVQKTDFELAWEKLVFKVNPFHYLYRGDLLSGLGQFGIIYFAFDDQLPLDQPVRGLNDLTGKPKDPENRPKVGLNFLRAFSQLNVDVDSVDEDPVSPRFGLPKYYNINFADPQPLNTTSTTPSGLTRKVHWTRVLHIADNRTESELYGVPRMQQVYNNLLDIRKVLGGSAEMYWKAAFPGFAFTTQKDTAGIEPDYEEIRDEFEEYYSGLKRYLSIAGLDITQLTPQVSDPSPQASAYLQAITTALDVPMTIFLGFQTGHLASTADLGTWNKRVAKRQNDYVNPMLIQPFIQRLMDVGVLPTVELFDIIWKDLNALSEKDKAEIGLKRAQTMLQYVTSGSEVVMPLYYMFIHLLGLSPEDAMTMTKLAEENNGVKDFVTRLVWLAKLAPGSGNTDMNSRTGVQNNDQTQAA